MYWTFYWVGTSAAHLAHELVSYEHIASRAGNICSNLQMNRRSVTGAWRECDGSVMETAHPPKVYQNQVL